MKDALLSAYHRLPGPMRSVAASVRGWYLSSVRYGPDVERLVEEALERESWNGERWKSWSEERRAAFLEHAARNVPFYRRQWEQRRRKGDRAPVDRIESWPILSKDQVRESPEAFLADHLDRRRLFCEQTSGTTGKPLRLWRSRETIRAWFALFETRVRRWSGVRREDRWAMLGGQLVVPVGRRKPPFWVWNAGMKQLYMSSYHLSEETVPAYIEAMRRHGVEYVLGYASSMTSVAQWALDRNVAAPFLRVAISNAEPLSNLQRQRISSAFDCPVRDTYGMAEMVCGASECARGSMHLWPEAGVPEVLDDDSNEALPAGAAGRLVCTGLLNADMPLVRYELGDRGALAGPESACGCGRLLQRIESIEGRFDDVILTPEGRRIGRLDPVFKANLPIREAQIIQEATNHVRVLIVPGRGFGPKHAEKVRQQLALRLGQSVTVAIETVEKIPRGPAGKFQAVVSRLGRAESKARAGGGVEGR